MTPDTSTSRTDDAAGAAPGEPQEGADLAPRPEAGPPSSVPGTGRAELGQVERETTTEAARELAETVRSVSRLEESD